MEKIRLLVVGLLLVALIGGYSWYLYQQSLNKESIASGTIEATEITVSSKAVGKVIAINVDEGSRVTEGEILAEIDAKELSEALKGAEAKFVMAQNDFSRSNKLYKNRTISQQQYDAAKASVDVAAAAKETARLQLDNAIIKAPLSGIVLVKAIEKGELATVGTPIVTMADLSAVKLSVYLAEQSIGKIKLGEAVPVSVDSYPGEKFSGKVVYISDQAEFTPKSIQTKEERTTQVFRIKIEIPNPEMKLKPGMPADAEFAWQ
jgi:HlyD family secretion protein